MNGATNPAVTQEHQEEDSPADDVFTPMDSLSNTATQTDQRAAGSAPKEGDGKEEACSKKRNLTFQEYRER